MAKAIPAIRFASEKTLALFVRQYGKQKGDYEILSCLDENGDETLFLCKHEGEFADNLTLSPTPVRISGDKSLLQFNGTTVAVGNDRRSKSLPELVGPITAL